MHTESLQSCPTLQAPLSMGFCRQDYWSGLPCCPPGDLSNPGIEPLSLMSPALAGRIFFTTGTSWEAWVILEWVTMPPSRGLNPHFLVSCIGKQVLYHKEQLLLYFLKLLPRIEIEETSSPTHFMTPTTLLPSLTRTLKERKVTDSTSS